MSGFPPKFEKFANILYPIVAAIFLLNGLAWLYVSQSAKQTSSGKTIYFVIGLIFIGLGVMELTAFLIYKKLSRKPSH